MQVALTNIGGFRWVSRRSRRTQQPVDVYRNWTLSQIVDNQESQKGLI